MRFAVTAAVLLLAVCAALGQGLRDSSAVVSVDAPTAVAADVGETVSITVGIDIDEGWHLYAHGDTTYYGISVTGLDSVPLAAAEVDYPAGHEGKFLGATVTLLEGREELTITGVLMAELDEPLAFELECQACDNKSCLAPAWIPFAVAVKPRDKHRQ
jgi:hypothetical protein